MKADYCTFTFVNAWYGQIVWNDNRVIDVKIKERDPEKISDDAKNALDFFLGNYASYENEILNGIIKYYQDRRSDLGNFAPDDPDYPEVKEIHEILKMITLIGITIPKQSLYGHHSVWLVYDCTWEEEHGLGVCLSEGKITEIGFQDCAV